MLTTLILICALGVSPQNCTADHALFVMRGTTHHTLPMACLREGPEILGRSALKPQDGKEYVKFSCEKHPEDSASKE